MLSPDAAITEWRDLFFFGIPTQVGAAREAVVGKNQENNVFVLVRLLKSS